MIHFETYRIPSAHLGEENPLPDIKNVQYIHAGYVCTSKISDDEKKYIGQGMLDSILPYKLQDGYDRCRENKEYQAAVLENDHLRAIFLPELGGRLWSLFDKKHNKELLFKNPNFQPANLGLRNAWFAGGVEFNVGIKGHNMLTCSPVFCEVAKTAEGEVLNLYEYERIRGVVYTVSAWLPEHSEVLYLRNRIENTEDKEKYMYWWSNIAVPESSGMRIVVPANEAFISHYLEDHYEVDKSPVPCALSTDISYPGNTAASHDFFFKIPSNEKKWIAAADCNGYGLLQCSTKELIGRKLFIWGQSQGGRNWNEYLSEPGMAYVEIQAGLAHTQLEHIPMPAKTEWSWVEAYTALECDPAKIHGAWADAIDCVKACIDKKIGDPDQLHFPSDASVTSRTIHSEGSGWGALEEKIRREPISRYHAFPVHTDDSETAFWHDILDEHIIKNPNPQQIPGSYLINNQLLKKMLDLSDKNWYVHLMIGIMRYAQKDFRGALEAWETSASITPNSWAMRNIAMLYKNEWNRIDIAETWMEKAMAIGPVIKSLCIEYAEILIAANHCEKWLALYNRLPISIRELGRVKLLYAVGLIKTERYSDAANIINATFTMSDIKEGELSISHIWNELYQRIYAQQTGIDDSEAACKMYPLPRSLDFRMQ